LYQSQLRTGKTRKWTVICSDWIWSKNKKARNGQSYALTNSCSYGPDAATKIGSMNAQTWNSCIVCGAQLAVEVVDEKWCISEFMTLLWALLNIVSVKCQFLVSTLRLGGLASLFFSRFLFCFLRDLQEFMPSNLFCVFKKPPLGYMSMMCHSFTLSWLC